MSTRAEPTAMRELLALLLDRATACSLALVSLPHIAAMLEQADAGDDVDVPAPPGFARWGEMFGSLLQKAPLLVGICRPRDPGVEGRYGDMLLLWLEAAMQQETPDDDTVAAVGEGRIDLDAALRRLELRRLEKQIALANAQLDDAAPVELDDELLAELAAMPTFTFQDVAVPVPPKACAPTRIDPDGLVVARFDYSGDLDRARRLYRTWSRRDGWLIEEEIDGDDGYIARYARGRVQLQQLLTRRPTGGDLLVSFRFRTRASS